MYSVKDTNRVILILFVIYDLQNNLDFKEIFKWIVSPKLAKSLNVNANLDGTFLIAFNFAIRDPNSKDSLSETVIIDRVLQDLEKVGFGM